MNAMQILTGFRQGSIASGVTEFASTLRSQAKVVQSAIDDLIPTAVNWADILHDGIDPANNSAQILGINDAVGIRVTWTPNLGIFYAKTSASAMASNDIRTNPAGWNRILNGSVLFASNNSHVGIATVDSGIVVSMSNADNSNQILDTFTCFDVGGGD